MSAAMAEELREPGNSGTWYSYAIVRVVPRVERGEFINVGVILFARTRRFLEARFALDEIRLRCLAPDVDVPLIQRHLADIAAVCSGSPGAGPMVAHSRSERFHWLTAPRSTVVQTSPVHVGRSADPIAAIEELLDSFVRRTTRGTKNASR
jgi:hypothetical protein